MKWGCSGLGVDGGRGRGAVGKEKGGGRKGRKKKAIGRKESSLNKNVALVVSGFLCIILHQLLS